MYTSNFSIDEIKYIETGLFKKFKCLCGEEKFITFSNIRIICFKKNIDKYNNFDIHNVQISPFIKLESYRWKIYTKKFYTRFGGILNIISKIPFIIVSLENQKTETFKNKNYTFNTTFNKNIYENIAILILICDNCEKNNKIEYLNNLEIPFDLQKLEKNKNTYINNIDLLRYKSNRNSLSVFNYDNYIQTMQKNFNIDANIENAVKKMFEYEKYKLMRTSDIKCFYCKKYLFTYNVYENGYNKIRKEYEINGVIQYNNITNNYTSDNNGNLLCKSCSCGTDISNVNKKYFEKMDNNLTEINTRCKNIERIL